MAYRLTFTLAVIVLCCAVASAQTSLIANGDFSEGTRGWNVPTGADCAASVVDSGLADHPKALHLELKPDPGAVVWAINLSQPVNAFMDEGDRLVMQVWARSPDRVKTGMYFEITKEPYTKPLFQMIEATPEWKLYEVTGTCPVNYSPGDTRLGFHLAYATGTIEIAAVTLQDLDLKARGGDRPTMDEPKSMIHNGDFAAGLTDDWTGPDGERLKAEVIDVDVEGYEKGLRLQTDPPEGGSPWSVGFGQVCDGLVFRNDAIYFRAWMRSPDKLRISFIYEMAAPPNSKSISQMVTLTPEWKEYRFMGRPDRGFRPGESQAKFFLGHGKGTLEVTGIRVDNYGGEAKDADFDQTIDYWGGREHPDTWRQPALERIEKIRKGDLSIRVLDADGNPVPDATVTVSQKRHHFRFGTAAPAGRFVDTTDPDNLRFQKEVERLYNVVTFENDLKWAGYSEGHLATVDKAVEWLQARDIDVRGHCLVWGSYQHLHQSVRDLRGNELLEACKQHVNQYADRMKGRLYLWDVVNEAGSNTEVWDEIGWEAFADSFRWARAADPDVQLCYNDYGILSDPSAYRAKVAKRIQYLLDNDAPVGVLGMQAHMSLPFTPIDRVLEIMDEWAQFGMPLEITEFDIGCWNDEAHAQYVRDFLIAGFSHPKLQAFIMWGFWEGSHWRSKDGGMMYRRDWSKRPAQDAWEDLVLKQWWTNWNGETEADGNAKLRAFYGKHEVVVEAAGKKTTALIDLAPGGESEFTVSLK